MRTVYVLDSITLRGVVLSDVLSLNVWAAGPRSRDTGALTQTNDRVTKLTGNWRVEPKREGSLLRLVSDVDQLVVQFREETEAL